MKNNDKNNIVTLDMKKIQRRKRVLIRRIDKLCEYNATLCDLNKAMSDDEYAEVYQRWKYEIDDKVYDRLGYLNDLEDTLEKLKMLGEIEVIET